MYNNNNATIRGQEGTNRYSLLIDEQSITRKILQAMEDTAEKL
jgi:hypothetical protein